MCRAMWTGLGVRISIDLGRATGGIHARRDTGGGDARSARSDALSDNRSNRAAHDADRRATAFSMQRPSATALQRPAGPQLIERNASGPGCGTL
jgi:hypothetical protein